MFQNVPVMDFTLKGWVGCLALSGMLFAGMVRGAAPGGPFQDQPLAIPVLRQDLKLDGILSDGEWDDAAVITGAIDQFEGTPSARAVTFRIKRGEQALYIAQCSTLKPRSPHPFWFKDGDDNSVVVALAPGVVNHGDAVSHYVLRFNPEGQRIGWEITDQYRGVKLRWPHLPWQNRAVAAEPEMAYGYGFKGMEQADDGEGPPVRIASHVDPVQGTWTSEMVIPLASMHVQAFPSDQTWGILLARDYPGVEQTAIVRSGDWRHGTANRSRNIGFYNLYRGTNDYAAISFPPGAAPVHIPVAVPIAEPSAGGGGPDVQIPSAYFSGYHHVDMPPQTSSSVSMSVYNPIRNEIFVRTRLGSVARGMDADRLAVSVRRMGEREPLMTHSVSNPSPTIAKAKRSDERSVRFPLPELEPGVYEAKLEVFDRENVLLGSNRELFRRYDHGKDLPWLGAKTGVAKTVLPGWTPIKATPVDDGLSLAVTGRAYQVADSGFLRQIQADGKAIFAAPMRLDIIQNGNRVELETTSGPLKVDAQGDEVRFAGQLGGGGWTVNIKGRFEYDGFCRFDLEMDPGGVQAVDAVRLEIPLRDEVAANLHAAGGIWMRDAVSAIILPERDGDLWSSSRSRRPVNGRGLVAGNFLPYVWIGNDAHGLAFMADNDQGWVPDETKTNSAQVVMRQDGHVSLVLNLVARPFTFSGPRRIVFGLQATPVKTVAPDVRGRMAKLSLNVAFTGFDPAGNGWDWNGQMVRLPDGKRSLVSGHGSNPYPLDWALSRRRGATNPRSPFAAEGDGAPVRDRGVEGYARSLRGSGYLPYQAMNAVLQPAEIEHPLVTGIHGANYYGYMGPAVFSDREWGDACMASPDVDYRLWHYRNWIRNSHLDGFYFDNTYPTLDALSSGYPLDLPDRPALHGKIQPGYALMNQRDFLKRLRNVFHEAGVNPVIWLHATDAFVIPAFAFADVLMDGEHSPGLTTAKPWSSERWPVRPPHMQTMSGAGKWGMGVYYLPMNRNFKTDDPDLRHLVDRNLNGYYALFDCPTEMRWPVFELDLDAAAVFHPYWGDVIARGVVCGEEGVAISAWQQGGRLYVLAFNFSTQTHLPARLLIRPEVFGLEGTRWSVRDLEPDDQVIYQTLWERKGINDYNAKYRGASLDYQVRDASVGVVVPILPRNYRTFVIEPAGE